MFLMRWLWKNLKDYRLIYCIALCMTVICQAMYIITPYFSQQIIDTFVFNDNSAENLAEHKDVLIYMLLAMIGFTLLRTIIHYSSNMIYEKSSQGLIYRVRKTLYENIQRQDASFYDYYRTGDIMTRLSGDLDMIRHSIAWIIKTILECFVLFTATTVYFFILDPLMALALLALTPVIFFISFLFRRKVGPMYVNLRDKLSDINTGAEENISGNRVVKAFAREEYEINKFGKMNADYSMANKAAAFTWLKFFPSMEITAQALSVVQLLVGGLFVINGRLTIGEFTAFSSLIWTLSNPMRTVGNIINDLQRFTASANKIIEIYYARPTIVDRIDAIDLNDRVNGEVEYRHVSFSYGKKTVLDDVSFSIKAGETVAIMGETGSGKTTLVEMLARIHDVHGGEILVDGNNIRMLKLDQLRSNIGVATQEVLLYSDTVEGNIAFGDTSLPQEEVYKCARASDADGFIRKMSEGYDTIIGERGVGLSGGQKQRIALARAIAVKPAILILDDTTSAVDLETEMHIQKSLSELDFPCTKIIIAQRISSSKNCDKIIVLKDGKIQEMGTHEELIKGNGYYREVYELQK